MYDAQLHKLEAQKREVYAKVEQAKTSVDKTTKAFCDALVSQNLLEKKTTAKVQK